LIVIIQKVFRKERIVEQENSVAQELKQRVNQ